MIIIILLLRNWYIFYHIYNIYEKSDLFMYHVFDDIVELFYDFFSKNYSKYLLGLSMSLFNLWSVVIRGGIHSNSLFYIFYEHFEYFHDFFHKMFPNITPSVSALPFFHHKFKEGREGTYSISMFLVFIKAFE